MSILKIYQGQALQTAVAEIVAPVQITYVALDQPEPDTLQALADLMTVTPHLALTTIHRPDGTADRVTVRGQNGRELTFIGAPLGTELAALVSAIIVAGRGSSGLSLQTQRGLANLCHPVLMEVFTTPT
jgi:alkyl hydroperoxide reductase subunit AhpF